MSRHLEGDGYVEQDVPEGLRAAAAGRTDLFDAVAVDEAQDELRARRRRFEAAIAEGVRLAGRMNTRSSADVLDNGAEAAMAHQSCYRR